MQWLLVIAALLAAPLVGDQQVPRATTPTGAAAVVVHIRLDDEAITPVAERFVHAEGEFQAAGKLRDAAEMIQHQPMAMQMRFLQTLVDVGAENNTTIVFPVPVELASTFLHGAPQTNGKPPEAEPAVGGLGTTRRS